MNFPTTTHHRYCQLAISDNPLAPVDSSAPVTPAPTGVATVVASATAATSDLGTVPSAHSNPAPYFVDTGVLFLNTLASTSDYLPITEASYRLLHPASTPVNPYTFITGEDIASDLASTATNSDTNSDSDPPFELITDLSTLTKVYFDIQVLGTATLTFLYSASTSELLKVLVEPTPVEIDWLQWVPLPRSTPAESYFHLLGFDYIEAFAFLHLYPLWIALLYLLVSALFALIRYE